jgi:tetratricopeptide (TPR) repeat protein
VSTQRIPGPHHQHEERLDRKALKGPDEFVLWTTQVARWAQANQTTVWAVGGALALVLLGAGGYRWYTGRQNDAAAAAFRTASETFAKGQYADAASGFETLAAEYPSTAFGQLALLYRGHSLTREDKPADAAVAYGEFLARSPDADYLRQIGLASQGHAYESAGEKQQARDAFAAAAEIDGPYRIDALLSYGRLSEDAGDAAAAEQAYRKILDEDPDPETLAFVQRKLPRDAAAKAGG